MLRLGGMCLRSSVSSTLYHLQCTWTRAHPCFAALLRKRVVPCCRYARQLSDTIMAELQIPTQFALFYFSSLFLLVSSISSLPLYYGYILFLPSDPLPGVFGLLGACHSPSPTLKPQRHYITLPMPSFCASKTRLPTIGSARITHKAGNWPRPDSHTPLQKLCVNGSLYLLLGKTRISTCIHHNGTRRKRKEKIGKGTFAPAESR